MPNWVENTLTVENKPLYVRKIINNADEVDFSIVIPEPSSINIDDDSNNHAKVLYYLSNRNNLSIRSVMNSKDNVAVLEAAGDAKYELKPNASQEEHDKFNQEKNSRSLKIIQAFVDRKSVEELNNLYEQGKCIVDNFHKYGVLTWFDWRVKYWGCKWNAGDSDINIDGDKAVISFHTPWSPPDKWLEALCKQNIPFRLEWIEEQGYHGEFISDGKTLTSNDLPFINSDDEDCDDNDESEE